jgi:hypothetical protein
MAASVLIVTIDGPAPRPMSLESFVGPVDREPQGPDGLESQPHQPCEGRAGDSRGWPVVMGLRTGEDPDAGAAWRGPHGTPAVPAFRTLAASRLFHQPGRLIVGGRRLYQTRNRLLAQ